MSPVSHEPLRLSAEELALMAELLHSERNRLLVEIRHTDHRAYRDELRLRLARVDSLAERCRSV